MSNEAPFLPAPEYDWEDYEERAAIMEHEGKLPRKEAEREAAKIVAYEPKIVAEARTILSSGQPQRKVRYTAPELVSLDTSEAAQLWDGFLPTNDIVLFAGVQGKGKSTLVRELSLAVARKDSLFLTRTLNVRYGKVIYVKGEGGVIHFARILKRYGGVMPEGFILIDGCRLNRQELHSEIKAELKRGAADLIVFDSLGNFYTGEQNSNSDAQNFLREFAYCTEDSCVCFIHHIGKSGHHESPDIKFVQGAGGFTQRARAVVMMVGNDSDNRRWLRLAKEDNVSEEFKKELLCIEFRESGYMSDGSRWPIEQVAERLRPVKAEDGNTVQVLREKARIMREAGDSIGQIAIRLCKSKSTIQDWTKGIVRLEAESVRNPNDDTERPNEGQIDLDVESVRSDKSPAKGANERQADGESNSQPKRRSKPKPRPKNL